MKTYLINCIGNRYYLYEEIPIINDSYEYARKHNATSNHVQPLFDLIPKEVPFRLKVTP